MQVVEDQHHRSLAGRLLEQARDRSVEEVALGLGIRLTRRRILGHAAADLRHQPRQLPAVAVRVRGERLLGSGVDVVPESLDPRPVGNAQLLVATAVEDARAVAMRLDREVRGKPRLPHTGLARDECDAPVSVARLLQHEGEPLPLGAPAHVAERRHLAQAAR